ncbi:hypothetical protein [Sphingobium sp. YR768]|uniref:hypothetical protein n=1 Tax=Sphingobium sp. YR768 TaxID=1884365 RepID=UPI00115FC077|nr:hypothetical protein [Sphingobium sp. YR768]
MAMALAMRATIWQPLQGCQCYKICFAIYEDGGRGAISFMASFRAGMRDAQKWMVAQTTCFSHMEGRKVRISVMTVRDR